MENLSIRNAETATTMGVYHGEAGDEPQIKTMTVAFIPFDS